jgi:hypothetical protein
MSTILAALLGLGLVAASTSLVVLYRRFRALRTRYAAVIDIDVAVAKSKAELESAVAAAEKAQADHQRQREALARDLAAAQDLAAKQREALNQKYAAALATYERLLREVALLEENLEDISFGIYKPHFSFESSDAYKQELERIRSRQKALVKNNQAATCAIEWEVRGSKREGARMQKQYLKLMLRAFNGETDAAVARVTWNNITRMEERIRKAHQAINELGGVMQMSISAEYLDLMLTELRLEFELQEKKHEEVEEQRRIKEQMREEEKAQREAERARKEAEEEEARYQKALEKARAEMEKAKGAALAQLKLKTEQLGLALQKAHEMKDKATSMAQLTRSGHVYVISNIGSFGENVFKIGMTRRLEPMDRVRELGDASVPFEFDVHAMMYSEDAPSLEGSFHEHFNSRRVNMVNERKEFFAVSLNEIEEFAQQHGLNIELTKLAEAKEYRQTLSLKEASQKKAAAKEAPKAAFPTAV